MFFELSGATNSTIGSDQIDYVNFRPNRATEWDSTPKRCSRASSLDAPLLGEADGAVAYHSENFQSAASRDAAEDESPQQCAAGRHNWRIRAHRSIEVGSSLMG